LPDSDKIYTIKKLTLIQPKYSKTSIMNLVRRLKSWTWRCNLDLGTWTSTQ